MLTYDFNSLHAGISQLGHLLKAAGKRIPENISLMVSEYNYANACFFPSITAIRKNFEQISKTAASQIVSACRKQFQPQGSLVPFQLIERQSVRKPDQEWRFLRS